MDVISPLCKYLPTPVITRLCSSFSDFVMPRTWLSIRCCNRASFVPAEVTLENKYSESRPLWVDSELVVSTRIKLIFSLDFHSSSHGSRRLCLFEDLICSRILNWPHHHEIEMEMVLVKLGSLWARMWRRTRLANAEWSTRANLSGMSSYLKKRSHRLRCQEPSVLFLGFQQIRENTKSQKGTHRLTGRVLTTIALVNERTREHYQRRFHSFFAWHKTSPKRYR